MNRPGFLATAAAAIAGSLVPLGATELPVSAASVTDVVKPVRHLFSLNGDFPWVVAKDVTEARMIYESSVGINEEDVVKQFPDDEPLTMMFDDEMDDLEIDEKCVCDALSLEQYGCACDAADHPTTRSASFWANEGARFVIDSDGFIGEYMP